MLTITKDEIEALPIKEIDDVMMSLHLNCILNNYKNTRGDDVNILAVHDYPAGVNILPNEMLTNGRQRLVYNP